MDEHGVTEHRQTVEGKFILTDEMVDGMYNMMKTKSFDEFKGFCECGSEDE